ncbi:MAG: glycosyltransferase family 2 protein, partial [Actinomycetota bacterium]
MLSVVTPAYCESGNLPLLYDRLVAALDGLDWEWIVVDDHSADGTFDTVSRLAERDPRVRGLRLSRNSGSHAALMCGLAQAGGDCAATISADGQDPPEVILEMLARWRAGAQVVFGARASRKHDSARKRFTANLFYMVLRRVSGLTLPEGGVDMLFLDRKVIDALGQMRERNMNLVALVSWLGFRQERVEYHRQARMEGRSKWTLAKQVKLAIDTVVSFSYIPIRFMAALGLMTSLVGLVYAAFVVANALFRHPTPGWSEMMIVILVLGGLQMVMLSVLGEYLWRTLEEA